MAEDTRDILMQVVTSGGQPPRSECMSKIASDDALAKAQGAFPAFASAAMGKGANFFAVEDFSMQVSLAGDAGGDSAAAGAVAEAQAQQADKMKELMKGLKETMPQLGDMKMTGMKSSSEFGRFMAKGKLARGNQTYSADLESISISRQVDASSLTLMRACLTSMTLKSASLLKRKATGSKIAGEKITSGNELQGFLRVDFKDVLITEFNWDEDDMVKEKFKFICREALVTYYLEEASGKLTPAGSSTWSRLNLGTAS
jgi:type VI protein secretion system component Hcp